MAILVIPDLGQFFQYILIEFNRRVSTLGVESVWQIINPDGIHYRYNVLWKWHPKECELNINITANKTPEIVSVIFDSVLPQEGVVGLNLVSRGTCIFTQFSRQNIEWEGLLQLTVIPLNHFRQ